MYKAQLLWKKDKRNMYRLKSILIPICFIIQSLYSLRTIICCQSVQKGNGKEFKNIYLQLSSTDFMLFPNKLKSQYQNQSFWSNQSNPRPIKLFSRREMRNI